MLKRPRLLVALALFSNLSVDAEPVTMANSTLMIEGRVAFTEGPAWHPSGSVYFTDIVNNRIMRRDPSGALHVYRTPSGRANGLLFDREGRLLACEGGGEIGASPDCARHLPLHFTG